MWKSEYKVWMATIIYRGNSGTNTYDPNVKTWFKFIKTYGALQAYMLLVVNKLLPSPFYESDTTDNTDNDWWVEDDPRYQLLIKLNNYVVTCNANEDYETTPAPFWREKGVIMQQSHTSLAFLVPNNERELYINKLKKHKFLVTCYSMTAEPEIEIDSLERIPMNINIYKDKQTKVLSGFYYSENPTTVNIGKLPFADDILDAASSELQEIIKQNYSELHVMNPVPNHDPSKPDGLFTQVLQVCKLIRDETKPPSYRNFRE